MDQETKHLVLDIFDMLMTDLNNRARGTASWFTYNMILEAQMKKLVDKYKLREE